MFLKFYNLREQPFGTTPNPRFLYPSVVHREALASLIYGIDSNMGFAALIAEPGMGKTTLLFHVLARLKNSARTAFLFETQCTSQGLLQYLLAELRVPTTDPDPVILHEKFKQVLYEESRMGRRVVVIIDEAQNLDVRVLETVRLLSNFETAEAKLLHIILVGQPQLAKQLGCPQMSQLLQRIPMMNFLRPLDPGEVKEYVDHRLRVAGYSGPQLFKTCALERIAELSRGVPRKINGLCFNALSLGCALATKQIERSLIDEVGADLDLGLLLKKVKATHPVSVGPAVSLPDVLQKAVETPSAETGQVGKVPVAGPAVSLLDVLQKAVETAPAETGKVPVAGPAVSLPDVLPKAVETPPAEIGQVGKVRVAGPTASVPAVIEKAVETAPAETRPVGKVPVAGPTGLPDVLQKAVETAPAETGQVGKVPVAGPAVSLPDVLPKAVETPPAEIGQVGKVPVAGPAVSLPDVLQEAVETPPAETGQVGKVPVAGPAVSLPDALQKAVETAPAETGQVGKFPVGENVIRDSACAPFETIGRIATTEDTLAQQGWNSTRARSSAVVSSELSHLSNRQSKEARAYIKEFLARCKPVAPTLQE